MNYARDLYFINIINLSICNLWQPLRIVIVKNPLNSRSLNSQVVTLMNSKAIEILQGVVKHHL